MRYTGPDAGTIYINLVGYINKVDLLHVVDHMALWSNLLWRNRARLVGRTSVGAHGYDPEISAMRGNLFAKGPGVWHTSLYLHSNKPHLYNLPSSVTGISAFKAGQVTPGVKMVDLYQNFLHILGIPLYKN